MLSALLRYGDAALPIGFAIVHKDLHFCDLKTKAEIRKAAKTKNEHFREITRKAVLNEVKFEHILADNWFGSKANREFVHRELKKKFIFGLKNKRLVAFSEEE